MQIFRVSEDFDTSAQFLDNRRLSKQILELYQIICVCLGQMGIIDVNTRYINHPVVQKVYNDGRPYLRDATELLKAMDREHFRRGGKRSPDFRDALDVLYETVDDRSHDGRFSTDRLPPFYIYGDERCDTQEAYSKYERLLFEKWKKDKVSARCSIKRQPRSL